jgi:hypothetical protein
VDLSKICFCLSEDREDCETGLRLAILSLNKHCPGSPVRVYRPKYGTSFSQWVAQFSNVMLIESSPRGATSWNCKPHALRPILDEGFSQAIWLDSDILVTQDCRPLLLRMDCNTLAVAQEPRSLPFQGTSFRTSGWGLPLGRSISFTLNSAVVRVTRAHLSLLSEWANLLSDSTYLACQKLPLMQRPLHLMGDQDILNALLGSEQFAAVPIHVFATGRDIIHAGGALGYSIGERWANLRSGKPTFLHATAGKPWLWMGGGEMWSRKDFFSWHRRLLQEVSPYVAEARMYRCQLGSDTNWMSRRTPVGLALRYMGLGHHALSGLPITAVATAIEQLR